MEQGEFQDFCLDFLPLYHDKYKGLKRHGATPEGKTRKGTPDLIKTFDNGKQIAAQQGTEKTYWVFQEFGESKPAKDIKSCIKYLLDLEEIVLLSNQEIQTNRANVESEIINNAKKITKATITIFSISNFEEEIKNNLNKYRNVLKKYLSNEDYSYIEKYIPSNFDLEELIKIKENDFKKLYLKSNKYMELEIETIVKEQNNDKKENDVFKIITLEDIIASEQNDILIGPSGTGKSTFLNYIGLKLLKQFNNKKLFPINVTAQELCNDPNIIIRKLENLYSNSPEIYSDWSNLIILIDGLDQSRDVNMIAGKFIANTAIITNFKKAKIIIASRECTANKLSYSLFRRIFLRLPNEQEIVKYLGKIKYIKLRKFFKNTNDIASIPILLEMLKSIQISEIKNIRTLNDLYNSFIDKLIAEEKHKISRIRHLDNEKKIIKRLLDSGLILKKFEKIAYDSLTSEEILSINYSHISNNFPEIEQDQEETLLNIGILLELLDKSEKNKYQFRHQSFQSYLTASYLRNNQESLDKVFEKINLFEKRDLDKSSSAFICNYKDDVWLEVLKFYIDLENNASQKEALIDTIYSKYLTSNNIVILIFIVIFLCGIQINSNKENNLIKEFADALINLTSQYREPDDYKLYQFCINKVKELYDIRIRSKLIDYLKNKLNMDNYLDVGRVVIDVIDKIGNHKDIYFLLNNFMFSDGTGAYDPSATAAFFKLASKKEIPVLIMYAERGPFDVYGMVAKKLVQIVFLPECAEYINLLDYPDNYPALLNKHQEKAAREIIKIYKDKFIKTKK